MKSKSILVLTITVLALVWTQTTMADLPNFPICVNGEGSEPVISGDIAVWQDSRNLNNYDIYGYNLSTETEFSICTAAGSQLAPSISGNTVVWYDTRDNNYDIYAYNLLTETEFCIRNSTSAHHPDISSNIVVWADGSNILGYNLSTETDFTVSTNGYGFAPAISGDNVVWGVPDEGIFVYDLSTSTESTIDIGSYFPSHVAISGDTVVWTDTYDYLHGYDLSTETAISVPSTGSQFFPAISGDWVVWEDRQKGATDGDIYGYNIATDMFIPIHTITGNQNYPDIDGDIVVWNNAGDIYRAYVPEPSTLLLLGFGAVILRRKR